MKINLVKKKDVEKKNIIYRNRKCFEFVNRNSALN